MSTTTLDDITEATRHLSEARANLGHMVSALNAGIQALKDDEMPAIREAIAQATAAWSDLEQLVQASPYLFIKPRTVAAHGITVGITKSKGTLQIENPDRTVLLIKRHLPDQVAVLVATKEAPVKKALEQLSAADLKRIGVTVEGVGDQVVIRPAPSDVDKLVKALLRSAVAEDDGDA